MERIKPCVEVTQKKSGRIAAEGSLKGNEDIFTWNLCKIYTKESGIISLRQ